MYPSLSSVPRFQVFRSIEFFSIRFVSFDYAVFLSFFLSFVFLLFFFFFFRFFLRLLSGFDPNFVRRVQNVGNFERLTLKIYFS